MTRLATCGWETGDPAEGGVNTIGASQSLTVVSSNPTPRAGGNYCMKIATTNSTFAQTIKTISFGAAKTEVWVRFGFYAHISAASVEIYFLNLLDSAAGSQCVLGYNTDDGLIRAYRGFSAANIIGTASLSFPQDTWHLIEMRWQATSATVGTVEVWLDGTRVINATSVDTTATTNVNVQSVTLGQTNASLSNAGTTTYLAYDDLAVNDVAGTVNNARPGDGRVVLLVPTGAGSSTQLTRGGTDSGANWDQANEVPPSMADYVWSATVAQRDLYAMSDLPITPASISCVEAVALCQNSDAGAGSIGLTVKSSATVNEATAIALGSTAAYAVARWEVDPNGSVAWTAAAVNALEAGATVR